MAKSEEEMRRELELVCRKHNIHPPDYCHSQRDGDCIWDGCPQNRDGEPRKTGRHCPIDIHDEERGYQ